MFSLYAAGLFLVKYFFEKRTFMDVQQFLFWEMASKDTIDFKKIYVDISNDDLVSGLLLSQIVYWHLPSKETGKTKLRVVKDNFYWLAKERTDWHDEIRISPKQFDRAIKILEKLKIVETKKFKFNGQPLVHIRLIWPNFLAAIQKQMAENNEEIDLDPYSPLGIPQTSIPESPKGEFPNRPKGNSGIDQKSIASITENTDIDYNTDNHRDYEKNVIPELSRFLAITFGRNLKADRVSLIINNYFHFHKELPFVEFKSLLLSMKSQLEKKAINNFESYLNACIKRALQERTERAQIRPKAPIRTEHTPEWFKEPSEYYAEPREDDIVKKSLIAIKLKKSRGEELTEEEDLLWKIQNK
jgi:hypothetical protein